MHSVEPIAVLQTCMTGMGDHGCLKGLCMGEWGIMHGCLKGTFCMPNTIMAWLHWRCLAFSFFCVFLWPTGAPIRHSAPQHALQQESERHCDDRQCRCQSATSGDIWKARIERELERFGVLAVPSGMPGFRSQGIGNC
jgi:hypothetical protein